MAVEEGLADLVLLKLVGAGQAWAPVVGGEGTDCARAGADCAGTVGNCFKLDAEEACSMCDICDLHLRICTLECLKMAGSPLA